MTQIVQKQQTLRIPLKLQQENTGIGENSNNNTILQSKLNSKSQRKHSHSQMYNKMSNYSKQKSQIPSKKQAKSRQKQIVNFHNRNFYQRHKRLEQIFKENCRIYIQLNKQKSHYFSNFKQIHEKKSKKKSHSMSCTEYNSKKIMQLDKASRDENIDFNQTKFERRFSFSFGRPQKQIINRNFLSKKEDMSAVQHDSSIGLIRYEKNSTEMYLVKRRKINLESTPTNLQMCIQYKKSNEGNYFRQKNPTYMRLKRRPNSGFRV